MSALESRAFNVRPIIELLRGRNAAISGTADFSHKNCVTNGLKSASRKAEERMKTAEARLRSFIERPDRQYSPEERAENKRLLDDLRLAMVEYSEAFEQAVRS